MGYGTNIVTGGGLVPNIRDGSTFGMYELFVVAFDGNWVVVGCCACDWVWDWVCVPYRDVPDRPLCRIGNRLGGGGRKWWFCFNGACGSLCGDFWRRLATDSWELVVAIGILQLDVMVLLLLVTSTESGTFVNAHRRNDLRFLDNLGDIRICDATFDGLDSNFADGVTVISGLWLEADDAETLVIGDTDFERSEPGDVDRLLQFFSHNSGVMRPPKKKKNLIRIYKSNECNSANLPSFALPLSFKWGFMSRWACVSLQNICILYWFKHLSEQNCNCDAPS